MGLPVRGQKTKTNARTRKGKARCRQEKVILNRYCLGECPMATAEKKTNRKS